MKTNNNKMRYQSNVDWWIWCLLIFAIVVVYVAAIGSHWWLAMIYGIFLALIFAVSVLGCWYEIAGDQLIVYQYFMPHKYPIRKIREIRKTVGYLYTVGLSRDRVSIRFTDKSVMKSSKPLEISPKDRDRFIESLNQINSDIIITS
ncbi:MAG: PH domain-containing protein, partial [Muribaculaceae bacterium]|nr:PH domain-containing protein [Muribaculaceae bacterium]